MIMNNVIQLQDYRPRSSACTTDSFRKNAKRASKLMFDLDGTLAALLEEISEIVNKSNDCLNSAQYDDVLLEEKHFDLIVSWSKFVKANNPATSSEFLKMWNELDNYYFILANNNGHKSFLASDVQDIWQAVYTPAIAHIPYQPEKKTVN